MAMALHLQALTLLSLQAAATWTGPSVEPVWNAAGVSALSIDGQASAPGFLVGNTQGGLKDDWAAWDVELRHAAAAGVRIFGICTDGSDLLSQPEVMLANHTRQMVDRVLASVPDALILPRVPIGAWLGAGSPHEHVVIMAADPGPGGNVPTWPNHTAGSTLQQGYGSMTAAWAADTATRVAKWLALLDAAYPKHIAGVHFSGLAAGEMRFESPPEDQGLADYSNATVADFYGGKPGCTAPSASQRCAPPSGNIFVSNASASYNLFISRQVQHTISAAAAAAKAAMDGKGMVIAFCKAHKQSPQQLNFLSDS